LLITNITESRQTLAIDFLLIFKHSDATAWNAPTFELVQTNGRILDFVIGLQCIYEQWLLRNRFNSAVDRIEPFWIMVWVMPLKYSLGLRYTLLYKGTEILKKG